MPMKKNLLPMDDNQPQTNFEQFQNAKQQTRKKGISHVDELQKSTKANVATNAQHNPRQRLQTNNPVPRAKVFALEHPESDDFDASGNFNHHKLPMTGFNFAKTSRGFPPQPLLRPEEPLQQVQKPKAGSKSRKHEQAPTTSAFDDTTSLDTGFLQDDPEEDNQTVVLRNDINTDVHSPAPIRGHHMGNGNSNHLFAGLATQEYDDLLQGDWQEEVAAERHQHQEIEAKQVKNSHDGKNAKSRTEGPFRQSTGPPNHDIPAAAKKPRPTTLRSEDVQETPSRTQSVPPTRGKSRVAVPQHVTFRSSPHFIQSPQAVEGGVDSPVMSSAQMAQEGSPEPLSRPASALSMTNHQGLPQRTQHARSASAQDASIHAARFQRTSQPSGFAFQNEPKESAADSDVHESSEDERRIPPQGQATSSIPGSPFQVDQTPGRKRSHGETTEILDYDKADLLKKSLADVQNEQYNFDPRVTQVQQGNEHNHVDLEQTLSTLKNLSIEAQRDFFKTLTDDEWAQTGQWFVNIFQTDFKNLMAIRLQRRKIALEYENKIRQRQRQVEHYQAGVENELKTLLAGGQDLLKDRKQPGSRAGTPSRPARA